MLPKFIEWLFTTFTPVTVIFLGITLVDWVTGIQASLYCGEWDSKVSRRGVYKLTAMLSLVLPIDMLVHYPIEMLSSYMPAMLLVTVGFSIMGAGSIVENLGKMDIELPDDLTSKLDRLKNKNKK